MKRLACKLVRLPRLAVVDFERPEVCPHQSLQTRLHRFRAVIFLFLNVKRSRCTERKALASVRSPGRPGALRPSFLGNAAGMLQHARAALRVAQPRLNGLRIVRHVGPKRQNCRKTMPCARMLKIGFRVRYAFPASNAHHRLHRVIQLRPPPEAPARPHAVRIHLQNPDMRTKPIQSRSDPPHDGTKNLARKLPKCETEKAAENPSRFIARLSGAIV